LPDPDSGSGPPENQHGKQQESLFFRVVRSAIAPDVLEDGGSDAPLSRRGKLVFYGVVGVLVVAIVVLLLVTAANQ
jgi:hypothetical protein